MAKFSSVKIFMEALIVSETSSQLWSCFFSMEERLGEMGAYDL